MCIALFHSLSSTGKKKYLYFNEMLFFWWDSWGMRFETAVQIYIYTYIYIKGNDLVNDYKFRLNQMKVFPSILYNLNDSSDSVSSWGTLWIAPCPRLAVYSAGKQALRCTTLVSHMACSPSWLTLVLLFSVTLCFDFKFFFLFSLEKWCHKLNITYML